MTNNCDPKLRSNNDSRFTVDHAELVAKAKFYAGKISMANSLRMMARR